jgi:hypothetical protein
MTKWRPRFSVRTLAIVVTLVSAYFGTWDATERFAEIELDTLFVDTYCVAPCLISRDQPSMGNRGYYFWFFGLQHKMPIEKRIPVVENGGTFP